MPVSKMAAVAVVADLMDGDDNRAIMEDKMLVDDLKSCNNSNRAGRRR